MRAALSSLVFIGLLITVFVHYGNRLPQFKPGAIADDFKAANPADPNSQQDIPKPLDPDELIKNHNKLITAQGPLAQWMQGGGNSPNPDPDDKRPPWHAHPNDHIAPSPVGTSGVILHKTFSIAKGASFPFTIPAHATMPQLHGSFHSSAQADNSSGDANPDIAFLLLNQDQYDSFFHGHLGDALVSVDSSHNQDINFGLPASMNQPVTYYLVFQNNPREGKKTVQADFKVDF